jgi:release factor glutamine methyltransferase
MTLRDALLEASTHIARRDAETLLAHTLHHDRAWLLAHAEDELSPKDLEFFRSLTARRAKQEPLQHITGTQEFFGLNLRVTPDVLIPRPETEHLVEAVLNWAHAQSDIQPQLADAVASRRLRIVDVGTGSGAIAIALASALDRASITAIDISPAALAVAYANALQHHLTRRIRFLHGDLLIPLLSHRTPKDPLYTSDPLNSFVFGADPFDPTLATADPLAFITSALDVVVSNPPYVALSEASTLAPEVRDHEPSVALYAGPDGLEIYRRLIPQAFDLLRSGGLLALEIGFGQRQALTELLANWQDVRFLNDYASVPRVVLAIRP